jgi:hypothetical protein
MALACLSTPILGQTELSAQPQTKPYYTVVQPYFPPPSPESYFGLLTDPVGQYGRAAYGSTTAFTLRGSPLFISRAYNLFASFGGETLKPETGAKDTRTETREPVLRKGDEPNSAFFCMPPYRARNALRIYLYCQLYKRYAIIQTVLDNDRELVDTICTNEEELNHDAMRLSESFYYYEILPDHRTIASYCCCSDQPTLEHVVWKQEYHNSFFD